MFQQYLALKAQQPGCLLFFRMGDFYELFFEDAVTASRELELTLTTRNKGDPDAIPMAGVPHHAAAGYLERLTAAGYRVAIADQIEDPALAKGLVARAIVRVVTPGVVNDASTLDARRPNYVVGLAAGPEALGLAYVDVSTGELCATTVRTLDELVAEVHRVEPVEALLSPELRGEARLTAAFKRHRTLVSEAPDAAWTVTGAQEEVQHVFGRDVSLDAADPALLAVAAVLAYGRAMSGSELRNIHELRRYAAQRFMVVDDATTRHLEIFRTQIEGRRKGSLIGLLDRCATAMGSRRLREWLRFPLLDPDAIRGRSAAVEAWVDEPACRDDVRTLLREVADVERIGARVAQGTAHARDLAGLRRSLIAAVQLRERLSGHPSLSGRLAADLCEDVRADLERWLADDPPATLTDGGVLRRDANAELDELITISVEGVGIIARVEEREREATGISSLKIRRNKVFGYFIEITRAHMHRVPDRYLRKQTLSNAERYITIELKELEEKVLGADERRKQLEYALFVELRDRVAQASRRLSALASSLAELDGLVALAEVAVRQRWVRPQLDDSERLAITAGRHPVVEAMLTEERFVPNDVTLDADGRQLIVLTGPNMAGKSTVMRQTGLIVLLAQIGSFVPADAAQIGVCDRIFTRVGAADDLSSGQSTFMVEMAETATILRHATRRSLVLLDEIGRGTSTYDGLSIAWAVGEDLAARVGCRGIFATHYHELCELEDAVAGVVNQSVAVSEWEDRIVFLRQLKDGGASRSYGIQCAQLAGMPPHVVTRARALLTHFEKHAPRNAQAQLSLFGAVPAQPSAEPEAAAPDPMRGAVAALNPDALSPREALDALYRLRALL